MDLLLWIICVFVSCVSHVFVSVHCCLVVTCWERADLLALVGDVYCIFVTSHVVFLDQVWYLIVLFLDLCHLSYFEDLNKEVGTLHSVQTAQICTVTL